MRRYRHNSDQEVYQAWLPPRAREEIAAEGRGKDQRWWLWFAQGNKGTIHREVKRAWAKGQRLGLFDFGRHEPPWWRVERASGPHDFEWGQNPDPRRRGLERTAASGDLEAAAQWVRERQRAGEKVAPAELIGLGLATGLEKLPYDKRGNHVIRTGHKGFDKQTRVISPGQVVGQTQYSNVIRPYNLKLWGEEPAEPGRLQEWDFHLFPTLDPFVRAFTANNTKTQPAILYMFRVARRGQRVPTMLDLGYVVTRPDGQLLGRFARDTPKSRAVIEAVTPIVSWHLLPEFADLIPTEVHGSTPHHKELWHTLTPRPYRRNPVRPCDDPYCRCLGEGHQCAGCGAEDCSCRRCERCKRLVKGRKGGGAPLYVTEEDEVLCGRCYRPNPDETLRRRERVAAASGTVEDRIRYAYERQRRGEDLERWELDPISYVFLQAVDWHEPYRRKRDGKLVFDPLPKAPRVEGQRKGYVRDEHAEAEPALVPEWVSPPGQIPHLGLRVGVRYGGWRPGTLHETELVYYPLGYPNPRPGFRSPTEEETKYEAVPLERFYVTPSSYPSYLNRGDLEETHRLASQSSWGDHAQRMEQIMHHRAIDWFVKHGAIPYTLPNPARSIPEHMTHWWRAYRRRVLVGVKNIKKAASFSEGSQVDSPSIHFEGRYTSQPDHNVKILYPHLWAWARIMGKTKAGRWKNPHG